VQFGQEWQENQDRAAEIQRAVEMQALAAALQQQSKNRIELFEPAPPDVEQMILRRVRARPEQPAHGRGGPRL
jgi:hypothetical protein